jgi:hypothetical protein
MPETALGPSSSGSVVLELGPGIGALILYTPPEMDGDEIELSPLGAAPVHRTHSQVRPRNTRDQTQYAAVYPQLAAGGYTIWRDNVTPATTVTVASGQVTTIRWPDPPPP